MIEIIFDEQLFEIVVKGLYKTTNSIKRNPQPPQASFMCIPRTAAARDVVRHRIPGLSLQWRHNGDYGVSNHQPHECLLNRLFRCRSKKTSSASLAFVWGIHRWPVNFPHKRPVTRRMFPFHDVILITRVSAHMGRMCTQSIVTFVAHIWFYMISSYSNMCTTELLSV